MGEKWMQIQMLFSHEDDGSVQNVEYSQPQSSSSPFPSLSYLLKMYIQEGRDEEYILTNPERPLQKLVLPALAFRGCHSWWWFPGRYKLYCFCKEKTTDMQLTAWLGQALNPFLLRHCCTAMSIFFAQLCMYADRAPVQQPNGQEPSFSASQFSGRPDAFYRHTCCSWLQKKSNTKIICWVAFPQNYRGRGRDSMVYISKEWGLEPDMTLFLKWGTSDLIYIYFCICKTSQGIKMLFC